MLISIVIPVYNSAVIEELANRIDSVFAGRQEKYEIIFVDDFSPSPTVWPTLIKLSENRKSIKAIQLSRNFGQHAATVCGLKEARGDFVITMDDDLEHSPEDIPNFLALRNHDIVIAQFRNRQHGLSKRVASRVKGIFDRIIIGTPRSIRLGSYRMLSRVVVDGMLSIRTPHPFIPALIFHISKDVVGLELDHHRRPVGKSGYTVAKSVRVFSNLIINNSSLVLRLVGYLGVLFACISFVLAMAVIYRKLAFGIAIRGWASLFAAIMLIGGVLLFGLGIIGAYLIRIIESSEVKPTYFVRQRTGFQGSEPRDAG